MDGYQYAKVLGVRDKKESLKYVKEATPLDQRQK